MSGGFVLAIGGPGFRILEKPALDFSGILRSKLPWWAGNLVRDYFGVVFRSDAVDAAVVTARPGVVEVEVGYRRISEAAQNVFFDSVSLDHCRLNHAGHFVVTAEGQQAAAQHPGDFTRLCFCLFSVFADEDGTRCPVGRGDVMMEVWQRNDFFADFGVPQADATGVSRLFIGDQASGALALEFFVGKPEQGGELVQR